MVSIAHPTPLRSHPVSNPAGCPVLVVDPDAAVRRVVTLVLEGAGFASRACASIEEAEELVATFRPRLVLVEACFARDGVRDLLDRLTMAGGTRPLMALMSAYPRGHRGAEDYFMPKPLEFDRLLHLLETIAEEPDR